MSAFHNVSDVNVAFGNPKADFNSVCSNILCIDIPVKDLKIHAQCRNIKDEYDELMLAFQNRDIKGIRDALCDIQVFALGAQHMLGVDGDADMKAVTDSLYSRLCRTKEEQDATVLKYAALGVEVYREGKFPTACVKCAKDFKDAFGNEYRAGKFLKCVNYKEPQFPEVVSVYDR